MSDIIFNVSVCGSVVDPSFAIPGFRSESPHKNVITLQVLEEPGAADQKR